MTTSIEPSTHPQVSRSTDQFAKSVFWWCGVYGLIILTPQFFLERQLGRDFPPELNHPEHFYGFLGVGTAWQVAFLVMSQNIRRYRGMILPSILEKLSFGLAGWILFLLGRLNPVVVVFATIDLIMAGLFWAADKSLGADQPSL